jgi:hypothetical protein
MEPEMFDIITDGIAVVALALSFYAVYQTSRIRRGDLTVNALREQSELTVLLDELEESLPGLKTKWNGAFALNGMTGSGHRTLKLQEIEQKITSASDLKRALADVAAAGSEAALAELFDLRAKANAIEKWVAGEEAQLATARPSSGR